MLNYYNKETNLEDFNLLITTFLLWIYVLYNCIMCKIDIEFDSSRNFMGRTSGPPFLCCK